MICSMSKEETAKSSEEHNLESFWNHSRKLCNTMQSHEPYIDSPKLRRRNTQIKCEKYNSGNLLLTLSESNRILTESKPQFQKKKIDYVQIQENTQLNPVEQQESATLLLTFGKSLLQMRETENDCKQAWETKSDIKLLYSVVVCSKF